VKRFAILFGAHGGGAWLDGQQSDFTNRFPALQHVQQHFVGISRGACIDAERTAADQVQSVAHLALQKQGCAGLELHWLEVAGQFGQRDAVQSAKQIDLAQQLGMFTTETCDDDAPPQSRFGQGIRRW
jgi:hypothetical protein